jgi:hypothetical protein
MVVRVAIDVQYVIFFFFFPIFMKIFKKIIKIYLDQIFYI